LMVFVDYGAVSGEEGATGHSGRATTPWRAVFFEVGDSETVFVGASPFMERPWVGVCRETPALRGRGR